MTTSTPFGDGSELDSFLLALDRHWSPDLPASPDDRYIAHLLAILARGVMEKRCAECREALWNLILLTFDANTTEDERLEFSRFLFESREELQRLEEFIQSGCPQQGPRPSEEAWWQTYVQWLIFWLTELKKRRKRENER